MTRMSAIVKLSPGKGAMRLTEVARPTPGPGQVVVEVYGAGLCGTDLHIMDGEWPTVPPVTLGHEVAGIVRHLGEGVDEAWRDSPVALESFFSTCEHCSSCLSGHRNLCPERVSIGSHVNGGFASEVLVPVRNLHRLPDGMDLHHAALLEPLGSVANCLLDPPVINPGDSVLVTGPGTMGILAAQIAQSSGAQVTLVGTARDVQRLSIAESLGLATATDENYSAGARPADVVIECSGHPLGAAFCLEHVGARGAYVQVGVFGKPVTVPLDKVLMKELTITSGLAAPTAAWHRAIALVESGKVSLGPLVTEVAGLGDWERIYTATREGKGMKFVFDPHL